MAENDERGGFFGFGNQWWIWIVVIIIIILLIFPGVFGGKDNCGPGYYKE